MRDALDALARLVMRRWAAGGIVIASIALVAAGAVHLARHAQIRVDESAPAGHPLRRELALVRKSFRGARPGLLVTVEAAAPRLAPAVQTVVEAFTALPDAEPEAVVEGGGGEQRFFDENRLALQSAAQLRSEVETLRERQGALAQLVGEGATLAGFFGAAARWLDDAGGPAGEARRAREVARLGRFADALRDTLTRLAGPAGLERTRLEEAIDELLHGGACASKPVESELSLDERTGRAAAHVRVVARRAELDAELAARFMRRADTLRARIARLHPDVTIRFSGEIARFDAEARAARADLIGIGTWALVAVLGLVAVGLRSTRGLGGLAIITVGAGVGTRAACEVLFSGVSHFGDAAAVVAAAVAAGSGAAFLAELGRELRASGSRTVPNAPVVRQSAASALASIGPTLAAGALVAVAGLLALAPAPLRPMRELGLGGALGVLFGLAAALLLPAFVAAGASLRARLGGRGRPRRRSASSRRLQLWLSGDFERRGFRALAVALIRRRVLVIAAALLIGIAAVVLGRAPGASWDSDGAVVEAPSARGFGADGFLVYGPLESIRRLDRRLEKQLGRPEANLAGSYSLADYLPDHGGAQADRVVLSRELLALIDGLEVPIGVGRLVLAEAERDRLRADFASGAVVLASLFADGAERSEAARVAAALDALAATMAAAPLLEPGSNAAGGRLDDAGAALARAEGARLEALAGRWLEAQLPPSAIAELKALARELDALAAQPGEHLTRDARALAAALLRLREQTAGQPAARAIGDRAELATLAEVAARLDDAAARLDVTAPDAARAVLVDSDAVAVPLHLAQRFVDDAGRYALKLRDPAALDRVTSRLEAAVALLRLRARREAPSVEPAQERLQRSIQQLRGRLTALSGAARSLDALAAAPGLAGPSGDGLTRDFDRLFSAALFDRVQLWRSAALSASAHITVDDVPAGARRDLVGRLGSGEPATLLRALPRDRTQDGLAATRRTIDEALAGLPGLHRTGGAELAAFTRDAARRTLAVAAALAALVLLTLHLFTRSLAADLVLLAPVALGLSLLSALARIAGIAVGLSGAAGVMLAGAFALGAGLHLHHGYWRELRETGWAAPERILGEAGRRVVVLAVATAAPLAALSLSSAPALAELGGMAALGLLFCLVAMLVLVPCLLSLMNDWIVPGVQFAAALYPDHLGLRLGRAVLGPWMRALPRPDPGAHFERTPDGIGIFSMRRPPLNLVDGAMCCFCYERQRATLADPSAGGFIFRSGLPTYYQLRDASGKLVAEKNGRPARIPASLVDGEAEFRLPDGCTLVGPIRVGSGGADLAVMAKNPVNALFVLRAAPLIATSAWYSQKPTVSICEGDAVGGGFELVLHTHVVFATRHARFGAPEVKRGLTLPYGVHALTLRAGGQAARRLMSTGELISAEEAVALGIADELIPDGVDPLEYALARMREPEMRDRVLQISILRRYGPPLGKLIEKSLKNYIRLLRSRETRTRIAAFIHDSNL